MTDDLLSECVIAVVGVPGRLDARSEQERIVDRVGVRGLELLPAVRVVLDDVRTADPPLHDFADLSAMAAAVRSYLRERHPDLSDPAVRAVVDRFTYDWK